ncbi:MAG: phosphatase PAP2 family protein [Candidatus Izemoplasmatales bacterium]|jgi:membrane-associated phospholipid phosphatase
MQFELDLIHWLQSFRSDFLDFFFQLWTVFGEELVIIAILGFLYWCYNKKIGEAIGITVFISLVTNSLIKAIVMRPRPFVVDQGIANIRPSTAPGYAFPSGHTQGAATTFGSLAIWLKKRWITICSVIIIVMVAISRMYLGVHYLTDVLAGAALAIGIAFLMHFIFKRVPDHDRLYRIILIGFSVAMLVTWVVSLFTVQATPDETNALRLYVQLEGLAKMYGAIVGFAIGLIVEHRKINFENHQVLWKNIVRMVVGVALVMGIRLVLKALFGLIINPEELNEGQLFASSIAVLFDLLRYFAMVFVAIGVYPYFFKKFNL